MTMAPVLGVRAREAQRQKEIADVPVLVLRDLLA